MKSASGCGWPGVRRSVRHTSETGTCCPSGAVAWIGLWADQLRLGAAGSSVACPELIVRPCRLIQMSQVAGRVSARVQLADGGGAVQVDLDSRAWQQLPQRDDGLELLIPRRAILWLRHGSEPGSAGLNAPGVG